MKLYTVSFANGTSANVKATGFQDAETKAKAKLGTSNAAYSNYQHITSNNGTSKLWSSGVFT